MASGPSAPLLAFLCLATLGALAWWFWLIGRRPARPPPLRRVVDGRAVHGIERRWRVGDPATGRRLLADLGRTPAVLVPHAAGWHVWAGPHLTVVPRAEGEPGAVTVEFTLPGRPHLLDGGAEPVAATAAAATMMPPAMAVAPPATATAAAAVAGLVEVPGNAIDLDRVPDPGRIRAFATLAEAAAAARVGRDARTDEVDHIVGGAAAHPRYYVVPVRGPAVGTRSVAGVTQRVWIRGTK